MVTIVYNSQLFYALLLRRVRLFFLLVCFLPSNFLLFGRLVSHDHLHGLSVPPTFYRALCVMT